MNIVYYSAIDGEEVKVWSCGLKRDLWIPCGNGIPDGIDIAIGAPVSDAVTCFCSEELCNDEHFCDDCGVESTSTVTTWTTDTTTPDWTATTTRTTVDQTTTSVLSTTSNPIDGCPYGWVNSLEGCFLFHHEVNTTWQDNQEECEWLGGFLAEPKAEEQIKLLVGKSKSYKKTKFLT
jgi:hypothetical protein